MNQITFEEAKRHICSYGTAVHCEMFRNYRRWYSGDDPASALFHYDRGCVIIESESDYNSQHYIDYRIHQCAPDAEIDAVTEEWREKCLRIAEKYENPVKWVIEFYVSNGELTEEKNRYYGWRNYARQGHAVEKDPRVRVLGENDMDMVRAACEPYLENDTNWGRQLAKDFHTLDYAWLTDYNAPFGFYGIFDGDTLCGMATATYDEDLNLAWLLDIYVRPDHRGKGYGKALVRTALADYPDKKWHYQAARDNDLSAALAKSLGFTLEGAGLFIL